MSTSPTPPQTPEPAPFENTEIRIISHSTLFYWWPVWAIGYLMFLLTMIDGNQMVIVPSHSEVGHDAVGTATDPNGASIDLNGRTVIAEPPPRALPAGAEAPEEPAKRLRYMHGSKNLGVIFSIVLILVITITSLPLRGFSSVIVIMVIVFMSIIFLLAGWWELIFRHFNSLAIYINAGGYLFIATALFLIWLIAFLFFDRQTYMIFSAGQLKVCLEVGGGETSYDTMGMVIQKHRDDLFRHWVLGLGSGDLTVKTSGANSHEFNLPNVLFVGAKLKMIEEMQRDRPVVRG